jgi:hypothetical protein
MGGWSRLSEAGPAFPSLEFDLSFFREAPIPCSETREER